MVQPSASAMSKLSDMSARGWLWPQLQYPSEEMRFERVREIGRGRFYEKSCQNKDAFITLNANGRNNNCARYGLRNIT